MTRRDVRGREEAIMSEVVPEVTSVNWENEVLKAQGLVMIDFWAT